MDKITVVICDDMICMCEFFKLLLNSSPEFICVGEAHNEKEAIQVVSLKKPDIVLLDVQMDVMDSGLRIMPVLKEKSPDTKIIMISVREDNEIVYDAIKKGAEDYFIKNQPTEEILEIIHRVYYGKNEISATVAKKIIEQYSVIENRQKSLMYMFNKMLTLSIREIEILKALCDGHSYSQIAKSNFVEEVTVRTQVNRILKKMEYHKINKLVEALKEIGVFSLFNNNTGS